MIVKYQVKLVIEYIKNVKSRFKLLYMVQQQLSKFHNLLVNVQVAKFLTKKVKHLHDVMILRGPFLSQVLEQHSFGVQMQEQQEPEIQKKY